MMEDVLISLIDSSRTTSNNGKTFESIQSRFQRLHVPRDEIEWLICDHCGEVINQLLFQQHIMHHDMFGFAYQLYHYEIGEEMKQMRLIERIHQKKAKREARQLGLELSSTASSSGSSSSSSSSSASSPPPSPTSLRELELGKKDITTIVKTKRKRAEEIVTDSGSSTNKKKKGRAKTATKDLMAMKKVKQEEIATKENRAEFEDQLCMKNLGIGYKKVFIDLRKVPNYFDNRGCVRSTNLDGKGRSPTKLRRSMRGAIIHGDDDSDELVALF